MFRLCSKRPDQQSQQIHTKGNNRTLNDLRSSKNHTQFIYNHHKRKCLMTTAVRQMIKPRLNTLMKIGVCASFRSHCRQKKRLSADLETIIIRMSNWNFQIKTLLPIIPYHGQEISKLVKQCADCTRINSFVKMGCKQRSKTV